MKVSERMKFLILVIVALCGLGFVIFAVFFNRGTLEVKGEVPFMIEVKGLKSISCDTTPCEAVLAPGKYSFQIVKTGKREIVTEVEIKRGAVTSINLDFENIPSVIPFGGWGLGQIIESQPRLNLNFDNVSLGIFSQSATTISTVVRSLTALSDVVISPNAELFAYDDGTKIHLRESTKINDKPVELPVASGTALTFSPDSTALYFLMIDPTSQKQALFKFTIVQSPDAPVQFELSAPLIYFGRTIASAKMAMSADEKKLALLDLSVAGQKTLYLINLVDFSKKIIKESSKISGFKFLPINNNLLAIEMVGTPVTLRNIYLYDTDNATEKQLPIFTDLKNLSQKKAGQVIFTLSRFATTNNIEEVRAQDGFEIDSFDYNSQEKEKLYSSETLNFPSRLEMGQDGKAIYLLIGQDIYIYTL